MAYRAGGVALATLGRIVGVLCGYLIQHRAHRVLGLRSPAALAGRTANSASIDRPRGAITERKTHKHRPAADDLDVRTGVRAERTGSRRAAAAKRSRGGGALTLCLALRGQLCYRPHPKLGVMEQPSLPTSPSPLTLFVGYVSDYRTSVAFPPSDRAPPPANYPDLNH